MSGDHNQYQKDKSYLDGMDRYKQVRELVKDLSLRVTEIAWKTGYNKGHVSRLRKEAMRQALETEQEPFEYWNAVEGWVKIDEVREHFNAVGCGTIYKSAGEGRSPLYTAPLKKEWVRLTDEEMRECAQAMNAEPLAEGWPELIKLARAVEEKIKEKNHG